MCARPDGTDPGTNPRTLQPNPDVDPANPRPRNAYGHILGWYDEHDFTEPTFGWDIFALGGDPDPNVPVPDDGSTIVGDTYGSPDGLDVAPSGRLWIQTDVSGPTINSRAYAGYGNDQMLRADPATRETRRFLVGPNVCEITGVFVTPDERTMSSASHTPAKRQPGRTIPPTRSVTARGRKARPTVDPGFIILPRDHQGRRRRHRWDEHLVHERWVPTRPRRWVS